MLGWGGSPSPMTDRSRWINTPTPLPTEWAVLNCVLFCVPEPHDGAEPQSPKVTTCSVTPLILASFPSPSHLPLPPPALPRIISQMNYLLTNPCLRSASAGTQPKHFLRSVFLSLTAKSALADMQFKLP